MARKDYFVLESFIDFLSARLDGFSSCSPKVKFHLADLAFKIEQKRFRHNTYDGYGSLPYQDITRKLGRNYLSLNESLGFFEFTADWSKKEKRTRGVRLSAKVKALKQEFLEGDPILSELVDETGKRLRTLPNNGLAQVSVTNRKNTAIKASIPVNHAALTRLRKTIRSAGKDAGIDADYLIQSINEIKHYSSTKVASKHRLIQRYHESKAGRLYASGVNLQNAPKLVKNAALSGCWEHDFENCHYSLFAQLATRVGIHCTAIEHYLGNKKAVREAIADDVGISAKDAKVCLLALMYGAQETCWHNAAIPSLIGDKARDLYQHPFFAKFSEEIAQSRKQIIRQWPVQSQRAIINAMGKRISKKEDERFIMAHIQQGLEARMLHIAIKHINEQHGNDELILLQHDGFSTLSNIDTQPIVSQIATELELSMQITSKMHRIGWSRTDRQGEETDRKNTRLVLTCKKEEKNRCSPRVTRRAAF